MDIAVVTGASSGLGLALSRRLLSLGFRVYGLGGNYNDSPLQNVEFRPVPCDLADPGLVEHKAREILAKEDAVALLVNNAKYYPAEAMEEGAGGEFARSLNINLLCPLILVRTFLPGLQRVRGKVVTINAAAPETARGGPVGAAAAGGLRWMQEVLFQQFRDRGITFSTISPEPNRWRPADAPKPPAERPQSAIDPQAIGDALESIVQQSRGNVITEIVIRPERLVESTIAPMREVPYPKPKPIPYTVPRELIEAEEQIDREEEDRRGHVQPDESGNASATGEGAKKRRRRRRRRRGDGDDRFEEEESESREPSRRTDEVDEGDDEEGDYLGSSAREDDDYRGSRKPDDEDGEDGNTSEARSERAPARDPGDRRSPATRDERRGSRSRGERRGSRDRGDRRSNGPRPERREDDPSNRPGRSERPEPRTAGEERRGPDREGRQSFQPRPSELRVAGRLSEEPAPTPTDSTESGGGRRRRKGRKPRPASREERRGVSLEPRPGPIEPRPAASAPEPTPAPAPRPADEVKPAAAKPVSSEAKPAPVETKKPESTPAESPTPAKKAVKKAAKKATKKTATKKTAAKKAAKKATKKAAKKATKKAATRKVARKSVAEADDS